MIFYVENQTKSIKQIQELVSFKRFQDTKAHLRTADLRLGHWKYKMSLRYLVVSIKKKVMRKGKKMKKKKDVSPRDTKPNQTELPMARTGVNWMKNNI